MLEEKFDLLPLLNYIDPATLSYVIIRGIKLLQSEHKK